MTKYWVQIEGHCDLPFTKDELFARFSGRLTADTPCAKLGENQWGKLSDYFPDWQNPSAETPAGSPGPEMALPPQGERYPALRLMGTLYRILAGLVGLAAVISIFIGFALSGNAIGWLLILYGVIGGFFGVLTNLALAQVIDLLLDIEKNTRKDSGHSL